MRDSFIIKGLYAITPDMADLNTLIHKTQLVIEGGAFMVQYRSKIQDRAVKIQQCAAILRLCREYGVPCIVNDDVEMCRILEADGVHLGENDDNIAEVRRILGEDAIIGSSCYDQLNRAKQAQEEGASYVAFGAVFPTPTKPNAPRATLALLREAKSEIQIPIVAIGGITVNNAHDVIEAGVDAIAVITSLFEAKTIKETAETFLKMFH
ncbi:MAG: thiamine phosphate synthase [Candidatus Methylopumilus sp.]|nr:thiamine phosphate synthase [Candidatus Methylopumilus sp.]